MNPDPKPNPNPNRNNPNNLLDKSTARDESSAVTFCSFHAMASSVIYYSTNAR